MRAVTFSTLGGPEVLELSDLPEPQAGPGEVRIRVAAATVNPTDISFRSGRQLTTAQLAEMGVLPPYIPGMELAGVVDAVGEGTDWRTGNRVMSRPASRTVESRQAGLAARTHVSSSGPRRPTRRSCSKSRAVLTGQNLPPRRMRE